ncbi:hypothetical protein G6N74_28400 [Mesorhizobium sp. CGMCC 1.15528]|uniref:Uncharacterized protein n=1 Tax=Mesorhizobium zhangyense TaxID=1776730 RepID=A0A7C9RBJ4_9HYPH|nr:hypothetical protein [Mesorhizobium zhangyense]NGN44982.1 hypothetical protein [Mesorhizobium zhangyense]
MWVRFLADYDFRLPGSTIAYKSGMTLNVTRAAAEAAVAAGKAVRLKTPRKGEKPEAADEKT